MLKRILLAGVVFSLAGMWNARGQILFTGFEHHGIGIIKASSNWWVGIPPFNSVDPIVTTNKPFTGSKSLAFPPITGYNTQGLAKAWLFSYTNSPARSPIIRFSAMLYMESANQTFDFYLGHGYDPELRFLVQPFTHHLYLGYQDSGQTVVTGRYARLTVYHNMDTRMSAMDYDGKNIIAWRNCGSILTQQFDHVFFYRYGTNNTDNFYMDDLCISSFPTGTLAWWRFDEGAGEKTADNMGFVRPLYVTNMYAGSWVPPSSDPIFDGRDDVLNTSGRSSYACEIVNTPSNMPVMAEWTIEAVMKLDPGPWDSPTILNWGDYRGGDQFAGARIGFQLGIAARPLIDVRDKDEPISNSYDHYYASNSVPMDGLWHHVAVVKQEEWLSFYIDYERVGYWAMSAVSSGSYQFSTNARIFIGRTFSSNAAARTEHALDELRISSRALAPEEFLQNPSATIRAVWGDPAASWMKVNLLSCKDKFYYTDVSGVISNDTRWSIRETFTATSLVHTVDITPPTIPNLTMRFWRSFDRPEW